MGQLRYNNDLNLIYEEVDFFKDNEIPSYILDFIQDISDNKIIFDEKYQEYYCGKCYHKLSRKNYCSSCHEKKKTNLLNIISVDNIDKLYSNTSYFYYYYFDIKDGNVLLYEFTESIYICHNYHINKISKIMINDVFLVNKDSLSSLINNKKYYYQDYFKESEVFSKALENDFEQIENISTEIYDFFFDHAGYLYLDNLESLSKTIYKYSYIWKSKKYLKNHDASLYDLTILSLCNKNFEYLIKYELYNLAYNANDLVFKNNFYNTFGLDKSYLDFMKKYDINYQEYIILKIIKVKDIKLIRKLSLYDYILEKINDYHINIIKVLKYFDINKIKYQYLYEYYDYIRICMELGINIKDKKILYPSNLFREHNRRYLEYEVMQDSEINNKIARISKILRINYYEDDHYIIFSPRNLKDLVDESANQNNCVRTYAKMYANGETFIYFLRKKNDINKSLVTIEVNNNRVVQAKIKNNLLPNKELMDVITKWEKTLIPINNSE